MRARNIKPGYFSNEDLAECSPWARLCFAGLWLLADREGRLEDRPKRIKGELFRFDSIEVDPLLDELQKHGFILRYAVNGLGIIQILAFGKHQNPHHREPPSDLPPPQSPGLGPHANPLKPRAGDSCDDGEALGKPRASPGIDPQDSTCQGGQAGLIPDSGFLIPDCGAKSPLPRRRSPAKTPLPDGFAVSDRVARWAGEKGHDRLQERLEHFVSKAKARGYTYVDWDEAFMTAVRDDWAGLNGRSPNGDASWADSQFAGAK